MGKRDYGANFREAGPFQLLFFIDLVMLVLLAMVYPATEPGSQSQFVAQLSFGIILVTMVGLGVVIYRGWDPF